jgi:hypothetical protein
MGCDRLYGTKRAGYEKWNARDRTISTPLRLQSIDMKYRQLHQGATPFALPTRFGLGLCRRITDFFKRQLEQLTRYRRTFDILIRPHFLRYPVSFLGMDGTNRVRLGPQIPRQADHDDRNAIACTKSTMNLSDPLRLCRGLEPEGGHGDIE